MMPIETRQSYKRDAEMTFRSFAGITFSIALATGGMALAGDKGPNATKNAETASGPVSQMTMAYDLYAHGVAQGDAITVLAAARIAAGVDAEDVTLDKTTEAIEGAAAEEGTGVDMPVDADAMLAKARELAGANEMILGLIEDAAAEGARGRIGGAKRQLSRLRAGHTDIWTIPYYGGRLAQVAVLGDGDADLDMVVTDENGNTICIDRSYSDQVICEWVPAWDGYFVVGVKNMGRIRNSYFLMTN